MDDWKQVTALAFRRLSFAPPPEREMLTVNDDGRFELWRSNGPIVGRFAGAVPDATALAALVSAAAATPPPAVPSALPPDAATEVVEVGDTSATVEAGEGADGPWGELISACRRLLDQLRDEPVAAVALVVESPTGARLEHRGREPLPLELDNATVAANVWHDGRQAG